MPSVCFYFQVHQPFRVKRYRIFDIGKDPNYFNDDGNGNLNNRRIVEKVARKCYLPANALLYELLLSHPSFKVSFSLSGVVLDQFEKYAPEVIESFQKLIATGRVELLSETYYHSLAFLYSKEEFGEQVAAHRLRIKRLFAFTLRVFRNTELIYNNDLAKMAEEMGYRGILAEGADHILGWRSPNFVYRPAGCSKIKLLLKNYRLSDDIAFRFSERSWRDFPLTAEKFARWISSHNGNGEIINLFMDYETFGEHQWEDTGIFNFLRALPSEILKHPDNNFVTPSEAIAKYASRDEVDVPSFVSWADVERDLSAWLSNPIQHDAAHTLYSLRERVLETKDQKLIEDWRCLQTSDHFYYMCTKWFADGDVHKYFNPYESPYDAFISFMNALRDVQLRIEQKVNKPPFLARGHPRERSEAA
ncbi:MAG: alpha-amylase [Candidatus Jacksonbacteria bacterium]|nr:alpha-amylase [Candidatus Jacksonbacteria bacterium]